MVRRRWVGYAFVAPAALHLLLFALIPIFAAFYLSFFKWDLLRDVRTPVGLTNYQQVAADHGFWNAMKNSAIYTLVGVPLGIAVALVVAVLVAQKLRGMGLFRTLYMFPAITGQVALAMVWIYVFLPERGLINAMLKTFGLPYQTDFLNSVQWAMPALIFMSIWVGLGQRMILFVAGMMGIPGSLYEAASLDGARPLHQFWKITLPMLAPTMLFVLVTSTISSFQVFTPVYMMTKGGPVDTTDVVGYHIYTTAWRDFQIGKASAQSFVLLIAISLVAWIQFRMMKRQLEGFSAE